MPRISEFLNDAAKTLWDHNVNHVLENAVSTGHKELDHRLGGFERGGVYLLGGVSGIGKTALAVDITYRIAVKSGGSVFYYTNQTSQNDLTKRLICLDAKIQWDKEGSAADEESEIQNTVEHLKEADIYISDRRRERIDQVIKNEVYNDPNKRFDLIVIDCMEQIYDAGPPELILCLCKHLAQEYNCPLLVITDCELMKTSEEDGYRPESVCFRTKTVAEYVDTFLELYRDEFFDPENGIKRQAELHILKSKYCNPYVVKMVYLEEYGAFIDCGGERR